MRAMLARILTALRTRRSRRHYREGETIRRFIAPGVRSEVEVVDAGEIEVGFVPGSRAGPQRRSLVVFSTCLCLPVWVASSV